MFKDEQRYDVWNQIRQQDLRAFERLLPQSLFQQAARRTGVSLGRSALTIPNLVWLSVLAAVHSTRCFAGVLSLTVRTLDLSVDGLPEKVDKARNNARRRRPKGSKHSPGGCDPVTVTEEAFTQARRRMPLRFWTMLIGLLGERFEAEHARLVRWKRFRLLALDGSTIRLPQRKRLRDHFGTAQNGKSKGTVQARMVMLQLPLVRLPWRYELCPIDEGERTIATRLLRDVRRNDLVLMDQGFWSYGLFHQCAAQGAFFGIRLYPNVQTRTLRRLGRKDRLVQWNKPSGPRWRGGDWPASQTLRIINYHIRGFRPSAIVTNVLNPRHISREAWVRMAAEGESGRSLDRRVRLRVGLYHRRWEIETTFHELKVAQGLERSLRSRTPESIHYEVAGHVVLYLLVRWLMVVAAQRAAPDGDPLGLSFKHALEELLTAWSALATADRLDVARRIMPRLLQAIARHPVSWRPGRRFARKNKSKHKRRRRKKSKTTTNSETS